MVCQTIVAITFAPAANEMDMPTVQQVEKIPVLIHKYDRVP
jgi:hypothetical protein